MALSFALHGLAILPLFLLAGTLGSTTSEEPALFLEFSVAAPTVGAEAEPAGAAADATVPPLPQPETPPEPEVASDSAVVEPSPPPDAPIAPPAEPAAQPPEPESAPEVVIDIPPPEAPPPPTAADLKPPEPPKAEQEPKPAPPKPAPSKAAPPKAAQPRPAAKAATVARAAAAPDAGNAAVTQQASAAPTESSIVWEGKPRYRVPPKPAVYPPRAIELGQQGEVLVRVRLDPDGSAAEIRLWRSSGFNLLDRSALAAVHGWHFLPAMRGGRPVAAWVEIPVRFHLR
jgi:periplasmic protein TonB